MPRTKKSTGARPQGPKATAPGRNRTRNKVVVEDNSDGSDNGSPAHPGASDDEEAETAPVSVIQQRQDSESELSDVKDGPAPKAKKRRKGSGSDKPPPASKAKAKKATKQPEKEDLSPDAAEIKRLQGWLLKCGIRKLWHKELAPYDSPKAKIKHLKDMLKDVGMDGRYSVEKASTIKERRELAADLEAVQEGNKQWGHESDEEEKGGARRKRVASRFVDFGEDEESD